MKNLNFTLPQKAMAIGLLFFIAAYTTSCKKDNKNPAPTPTTTVTGPFAYVGGSAASGATYWKISISQSGAAITKDSIAKSQSVTAITSSGGDVYIAAQTAGYLKNNTFVPVAGSSSIEYIAVSANGVYTAGYDNGANIAYWNNNAEVSLQSTIGRNLFPNQGVSTYGLSGITASANATYVTGLLFSENEPLTPPNTLSGNFGLVWTNGGLNLLGKGYLTSAYYQSTVGIALLGSDVYVAGQIPDSTYAGGYWKNGTWNALNNGSFIPRSIITAGNDFYITGYNYTRGSNTTMPAGYWKSNTFITISGALSTSAIAINGSDVYVLGIDNHNNNVLWKNGVLFATISPSTSTTATTLAIGN